MDDATDWAGLLPFAREAMARARAIIRSRAPASITAKGERDMVTDIDLAVEEAIRDFLARETPELGFLGEEHGRSGPAGPTWVLDPVDGTANFTRGIPLCGVSLALVEAGRPVVGAIDLPFLDVRYTAAAGFGAYAGERRLRVSPVADLPGAMISIGDFATGPHAEATNRVRLALLERLGGRAQRIRMIGTAAIDLAWVAEGRLEATVILANKPWDTMAGALLVREAGGEVLDRDGTPHTTDSLATIAVCPGVRAAVMATLQEALVKG